MTRSARQSFLGPDSAAIFASMTVGVVGLGGGGSHIVQQLAHVGIAGMVCVDPDIAEDSNLNRLVGGTCHDAINGVEKIAIARRMVTGLIAQPRLRTFARKWQDATQALAECDIIIGGLDTYRERDELESFCRRLLIPYIDMGMDVHKVGDHFAISGQVILSSPGAPCLWCLGVLTGDRLRLEALDYGQAGGKPQVVWPNGVLASLAVGLLVQLVSPWMPGPVDTAYLEFDGNRHQVSTSNRLNAVRGQPCRHYPDHQTGDPLFDIRRSTTADNDDDLIEAPTEASAPWWRLLWRRLFG